MIKPESVSRASVVAGAKILLAAVSPFQSLFDTPSITHEFLNRQALIILRRDGHVRCADFFEQYINELNAGVHWADKGWKNSSHYFEPGTGKGLWQFPTALDDFSGYLQVALASAWQGDIRKSAFFLGVTAHLVQDLCVPHHARGKLFSGHKEYESWIKDHFSAYTVNNNGLYSQSALPHDLLVNNAVVAADLLDWVVEENHTLYHAATTILFPRAQQSTAGLFERFFALAAFNCRTPQNTLIADAVTVA
ncbi:MAG TPA: zinc dependent phospholipase C family protein [Methylomusa anaerophila]|uniref:Phospholipase C n=1 Tax=Methylomusa anaerophila TaxID=1930071 RepID=A0A348AJJ7_9FIRM|nr:zinc dependent phospholipase C family protein [Methylomusa anaerophila]BBB91245.1 zinc dependent phospholipase C [Methylomusa anaerophila]HML89761.1 zinc dependent phospholipase C family protein [Methylomusa anaerophila]